MPATFEEIFTTLDLQKIEQEIITDPESPRASILGFEYEEVKRLVVAAGQKWLVDDLQYIRPKSLLIETPFDASFGKTKVRGIIDLGAQLNTHFYLPEYRNKKIVADWKTSGGDLDSTWQDRLVASHQWGLYAAVHGAEVISYRGVSRQGRTREVLIHVPEGNYDLTARHFTQVGGLVRHMMDTGADVWPMHRPSSCGAFNSICPFFQECATDSAPRFTLDSSKLVLSYSSAERFLLCPERYRRLADQDARGRDGTDATRTGGAFHRGIAEVYRQAFELYGGKL